MVKSLKVHICQKSALLQKWLMKNKVCVHKNCLLNLYTNFYFSTLLSKSCDLARISFVDLSTRRSIEPSPTGDIPGHLNFI